MAATYRASAISGNATSGTEPTVVLTPVVGDIFIVTCAAKGNTNASPTCSDNNGGTYYLLPTATYRTSLDTFSVFVRNQKLINVNSTTITVTIGAHTQAEVAVVAVAGMSLVGSGSVRQSAKTDNNTTTPTATFGAVALTANFTLAAIGYDLSAATLATPPTNWTERQEAGQTTGASVEVATRDSGFTGTVVTWGAALNEANAAYILELDGTLSSIGYSGSFDAITSSQEGVQKNEGTWKGSSFAGSGINPQPRYFLTCADTANVRHNWVDYTPFFVTGSAPVIAPQTYLTGTFAILVAA